MYSAPSDKNIKSIKITAKTVDGGEAVIEKIE
jgi:hypothetical protein